MRSSQPDLFADIVPAKKRGRKFKQPAEVLAFPMSAHVSVRAMADLMAAMPPKDRNPFWRKHARSLVQERVAAGVPHAAARAAVIEYTAAVRRLSRYLEADPAARLGRGGA